MLANYIAGSQVVSDGPLIRARGGNLGQGMVDNLLPRYAEQLMRGQVFVYHVASQALLLAATTGGHPTIFNPLGSGVNWIPLRLEISFISGTTTISGLVWRKTLNAGAQAATAAPILTATLVTPDNGMMGMSGSPKVLWSPTTNTFTAAPAAFMSAGINLGAAAPTAGTIVSSVYNGEWGVAPGNAVSLCATVTTTTALFQITIVGMEVPIV